jgi:hypothetical protein
MFMLVFAFLLSFIAANQAGSCLAPNQNYSFPPTKITGEYFQWLRQISDQGII